MDGRGSSDSGSYFNTQLHLHGLDAAASIGTACKEISPVPFSSAAIYVSAEPSSVTATIAAESAKRKRGRPRKYGASPSVASLSLPLAAARSSPVLLRSSPSSVLRKKGAVSSNSSARKAQLTALGNAGQGFTPHVITVSAGEDLVTKLVSMMQQGKRAVCVLSATGSILNPSLRQPSSSRANEAFEVQMKKNITQVYSRRAALLDVDPELEGMFDIISLSGALTYTKAGGTISRTSGLGICLSGVDGRIVGGGVEGPLMAAGPVQVIAGSFLIDINTDLSASTKVDDCTNELSTEAAASATLPSPVSMESTLWSKRRMTASRGSEDYQSMVGGYHLFHSRPIFPSPDWDGPAL